MLLQRIPQAVGVLTLLAGVVACNATSAKDVKAPAKVVNYYGTPEYLAQKGLAHINVKAAYEAGATGKGMVAAIIDSGIDLDNSEFSGRLHPDSANLTEGGASLQDNDRGHGTRVASILAAAHDGEGVQGVAPDAEILMFVGYPPPLRKEAVKRAIAANARVLNISSGNNKPESRALYSDFIADAAAGDIVTVFAAGNKGLPSPGTAVLGALDVAGPQKTLIVGAIDENNQIKSGSNKAGESKSIYLVAPGYRNATTIVGAAPGELGTIGATSGAAPHVAGGAVLLRQLWPALTADQVVAAFLESAIDLGEPGVDDIYGHGLVDVSAAFNLLKSKYGAPELN